MVFFSKRGEKTWERILLLIIEVDYTILFITEISENSALTFLISKSN